MSAAARREGKKLSDLLEEEEDIQPPFGPTQSPATTTEPAAPKDAPETPGTGGADVSPREGENGRQNRSERAVGGDEDDDAPRARTTTPSNRGKADTTRGRGRGRRPAPARVELSKTQRDDWRWRLRSLAGKLKADEEALQETEQRWDDLLAQAREAGVPDAMLLVALMDAGLEEPERYM